MAAKETKDVSRQCRLDSTIPLTLVLLILCLTIHSTIAAPSSFHSRVQREDDGHGIARGSRSVKTSVKTTTTTTSSRTFGTGKGPRGSLFPGSAGRRRLQLESMGVAPLSEGYGGSGGQSMTAGSDAFDMREQIVPVSPTPAPTPDMRNITFLPGALTVMEGELILSQGLTSRLIAISGEPVRYADGTSSDIDFHDWPDGAACFPDNRAGNSGGWIYVSNLEDKRGGVGAITFNAAGNILDYKMVLEDTVYNCNGGKTPWDTWISAEEDFDKGRGRPWQVDPYGIREAEPINMGLEGGSFEAFASDVRNTAIPRFFLTEDSVFGALERFTPTQPNWNDPWNILMGRGVHQWLLLSPDPSSNYNRGKYSWTMDINLARSNAAMHYPESEGIDVAGSTLCFVCKGIKMLFMLDLDSDTYTRHSTDNGLFEGEPDMIRNVLSDEEDGESMLYFTEDNGRRAGIHARNQAGELMTIMEGFYTPETTGLAVSPNGMFMYVCFQEDGYCFSLSRTDGLSFRAKTLNVKRHSTEGSFSKQNRGLKEESRKARRQRRFV